MNVRTWIVACVVCAGLKGAAAAPPDHIVNKPGKHFWQAIYPDDDLPNRLECGALRLKITQGADTSVTAKLYIFEKQSEGYEFRETISLKGNFTTFGGVSDHGRVTFNLKPNDASTWPYIVKGTYYIGKGKIKGNTDTIVLRFLPRATGIPDGPCDEAPDEDVLEEMSLPGGSTSPEDPPVP